MNIPVWINADILNGPDGQSKPIPVDAKKFFEAAKRLENPTLSIGWTTPLHIGASQGYSDDGVQAMIKAIQDNQISKTCPITFPVRAALVVNSMESLKHLYEAVSKENPTTFTVWSANQDKVDAKRLQAFINLFGVDKVYVDVPEELRNELDLSGATSGLWSNYHNQTLYRLFWILHWNKSVSCEHFLWIICT